MPEENTLKIFLDTDVAFDIISKREPHYNKAVELLQLAIKERFILCISECSIANLFYLSFDSFKLKDAELRLLNFISATQIFSGGKAVAAKALKSSFKDKEDALQYYTALEGKANYFVTRNIKDFKNAEASLEVFTPDQFMRKIGHEKT